MDAPDAPHTPKYLDGGATTIPGKSAFVELQQHGYGAIRGGYQHFGAQGGQDSGFPSPRSALGYPFPPMHQNSYSGYHLGSYAPPCSSPPKDDIEPFNHSLNNIDQNYIGYLEMFCAKYSRNKAFIVDVLPNNISFIDGLKDFITFDFSFPVNNEIENQNCFIEYRSIYNEFQMFYEISRDKYSGSVELNDSRNISMDYEKASSLSSDESMQMGSSTSVQGSSVPLTTIKLLQYTPSTKYRGTTPNTLLIQPFVHLGQSSPNLNLNASQTTNMLLVPRTSSSGHSNLLSPSQRGISYPLPSPTRGSVELNDSRNISMDYEKASSLSSDESMQMGSSTSVQGSSVPLTTIKLLQYTPSTKYRGTTPNTLLIQPFVHLGQSSPNLNLNASQTTNMLLVPRTSSSGHSNLLSPSQRGISYPLPSPTRAILRRDLAFSASIKNPPLIKSRNIQSQASFTAKVPVPLIGGTQPVISQQTIESIMYPL